MPGNVGTIGRLAYATGSVLHLIKPYGFGEINEKQVRRAGLDYWKYLDVREYENIEEFLEKNKQARCFYATTKTTKPFFEAVYKSGDYFFFGREDAGLPEDLLKNNQEYCINIPMTNEARSLNIANSVSVIVYDAIRQNHEEFINL
jgi:tRNA (cytidine/uridine-2'-O-)-methyltransferase